MYKLPLSPIDLTTIYKEKMNDSDNYVLLVDYAASKEVLTSKQILTYLANTGFRCAFSEIDYDLIEEFLQLKFLVDSPTLARVIGNIIKYRLGEDIVENHSIEFIENCETSTINDLIEDLSGLPAFIIDSVNNMDNDLSINIETNGNDSSDSLVGLNIYNIIIYATDAVTSVFAKLGFKYEYNTNIFNNKSNYGGKDILKALNEQNIPAFIMGFIPDELRESIPK